MSDYLSEIICEAYMDPESNTDGWGSLDDNKHRLWRNLKTGIVFRHNGLKWVPYDKLDLSYIYI